MNFEEHNDDSENDFGDETENSNNFAHLKFLKLLMNKSLSHVSAKKEDSFTPNDLGVGKNNNSNDSDLGGDDEDDQDSPRLVKRKTVKPASQSISYDQSSDIDEDKKEDTTKPVEESNAITPRKTVFKKGTVINEFLGKALLSDILKRNSLKKAINSFHVKPAKELWRF